MWFKPDLAEVLQNLQLHSVYGCKSPDKNRFLKNLIFKSISNCDDDVDDDVDNDDCNNNDDNDDFNELDIPLSCLADH